MKYFAQQWTILHCTVMQYSSLQYILVQCSTPAWPVAGGRVAACGPVTRNNQALPRHVGSLGWQTTFHATLQSGVWDFITHLTQVWSVGLHSVLHSSLECYTTFHTTFQPGVWDYIPCHTTPWSVWLHFVPNSILECEITFHAPV